MSFMELSECMKFDEIDFVFFVFGKYVWREYNRFCFY